MHILNNQAFSHIIPKLNQTQWAQGETNFHLEMHMLFLSLSFLLCFRLTRRSSWGSVSRKPQQWSTSLGIWSALEQRGLSACLTVVLKDHEFSGECTNPTPLLCGFVQSGAVKAGGQEVRPHSAEAGLPCLLPELSDPELGGQLQHLPTQFGPNGPPRALQVRRHWLWLHEPPSSIWKCLSALSWCLAQHKDWMQGKLKTVTVWSEGMCASVILCAADICLLWIKGYSGY